MLHSINASAPIHAVDRGAVDLSHVLNLDAYAAGSKSFHAPPSLPPSNLTTRHAGLSSLTVPLPVLDDVASGSRFDVLLRSLLWDGRLPGADSDPVDILRTKALLLARDGSYGASRLSLHLYRLIWKLVHSATRCSRSV